MHGSLQETTVCARVFALRQTLLHLRPTRTRLQKRRTIHVVLSTGTASRGSQALSTLAVGGAHTFWELGLLLDEIRLFSRTLRFRGGHGSGAVRIMRGMKRFADTWLSEGVNAQFTLYFQRCSNSSNIHQRHHENSLHLETIGFVDSKS